MRESRVAESGVGRWMLGSSAYRCTMPSYGWTALFPDRAVAGNAMHAETVARHHYSCKIPAEFFPENPAGYYAYPVDPDSAMCLEVFAGMELGREMLPGTAESHAMPTGIPIRRYSTPGSSPSSFEYCAAQSPNALSDSGKQNLKPQYTAELDVLCRICGDRASGFHYGVHSCEGCKGFFRRTLKKQLTYKACQLGNSCKIDAGTRNKCQYCRYQRCLNAGMSQDAVRFGRMPKTEREKLMADKEELLCTTSKRIVELRSLTDLIKAAFRDVFHNTIFFSNPENCPTGPANSASPSSHAPSTLSQPPVSCFAGVGLAGSVGGLGVGVGGGMVGGGGGGIYGPHNHTMSSSSSASTSPFDTSATHMGDMAEVLHSLTTEEFHEREIFWRFQEVLLPVMEASVKFAKRLPGFTSLPMPDQIELMKQNGFMVVHLALHTIVDNDLIKLDTHAGGGLRIYRHSPRLCEQLQNLLERPLAVGERLRSMRLTYGELALFAAVLLTSERPGLHSPKPVEDLQSDLLEALRLDLVHNHPKDRLLFPKLLVLIPDLLQIVEEFCENLKSHVFDPTPDFSKTKPLLREIFELTC
ncbi:peroxisome proliferator-activated receptor delta-like [Littorina saxatilis]|uniref:peroxisome proliferator-activated receptor delta-like n=1 Tax=Littorina saxatilis TaxID=31220 RepID=UPI0038B66852